MITINKYLELTENGKEVEFKIGFRKAREQLGMTRKELAEELGISPRTVESFELGYRDNPGLMTMQYFKRILEGKQ